MLAVRHDLADVLANRAAAFVAAPPLDHVGATAAAATTAAAAVCDIGVTAARGIGLVGIVIRRAPPVARAVKTLRGGGLVDEDLHAPFLFPVQLVERAGEFVMMRRQQ